LLHEAPESLQRLSADVVLDSLRVDARGLRANAERAEEGLDDLVPKPARFGQPTSIFSQKDTAIGTLHDEPIGCEAFQHLRNGRLSDPKALCDVDLSCLASIIEEIGDEFDVIFHKLGATSLSRLPEAFDLGFRLDECAFGWVNPFQFCRHSKESKGVQAG
jgi:hypothetical protein